MVIQAEIKQNSKDLEVSRNQLITTYCQKLKEYNLNDYADDHITFLTQEEEISMNIKNVLDFETYKYDKVFEF